MASLSLTHFDHLDATVGPSSRATLLAAHVASTVKVACVRTPLTEVVLASLSLSKAVHGTLARAPDEYTASLVVDVDMADIAPLSPAHVLGARDLQFLLLCANEDSQHQGSRSGSGVVRTDVRAARKKRRFAPYSFKPHAERKKRVQAPTSIELNIADSLRV